jgi:hypothetical protein
MSAHRRHENEAGALFVGKVMHHRLRPFRHRFVYRVFSLYLDIDRIGDAARRLRWLSVNRPNLFAFYDRDHGARDGSALRPWVEAGLARRGIDLEGGAIRLLCFPRVLGYVFNPLSIYYCFHADGSLRAILYEVKNTFGDQHAYVLPVEERAKGGGPVEQAVDKHFYVSPFIGMEARYRFRLAPPGERLQVAIRQSVPEGQLLVATLTGRRRRLTDRALAWAFVTHPLMTVKVVAAIHWEALWLWAKGATFHRRPPPPQEDVSW